MREGSNDSVIRRFLLGDVDEEERERIERRFISDRETYEKIVVVEDELIEDYLEGSLTTADREKFLAQYGQTREEQRRLRIIQAIKQHAGARAKPTQIATKTRSKWPVVLSLPRLRNARFFVPVAAILIIVFVIGLVWLRDVRNQRAQENKRLTIERELAELNSPSAVHPDTAQAVSLILAPITHRAAGPQPEHRTRADVSILELKLLWIQKEQYSSYRAVLQRVGDGQQLSVPNLQVEKRDGSSAVLLKIPTRLLSRGLYQVSLTGFGSDHTPSHTEEYTFTVRD